MDDGLGAIFLAAFVGLGFLWVTSQAGLFYGSYDKKTSVLTCKYVYPFGLKTLQHDVDPDDAICKRVIQIGQ